MRGRITQSTRLLPLGVAVSPGYISHRAWLNHAKARQSTPTSQNAQNEPTAPTFRGEVQKAQRTHRATKTHTAPQLKVFRAEQSHLPKRQAFPPKLHPPPRGRQPSRPRRLQRAGSRRSAPLPRQGTLGLECRDVLEIKEQAMDQVNASKTTTMPRKFRLGMLCAI